MLLFNITAKMALLGIIRTLKFWIISGLIFSLLYRLNSDFYKDHSPLHFIELFLFILFIGGLWLNRNGILYRFFKPIQGNGLIYVLLSWIFGMLFELTLSTGPGGIGGMHPKTIPSFIMAQGFYWPFAIFGLILIRRYHYSLKELYFTSIAGSMTEGILFNRIIPALLFSPLFMFIPPAVAYYGLVYSFFLCLPLIFIDPQSLYGTNFVQISLKRKILYGFLITLVSFLIFGLWSFVTLTIFDGFKSF